MNLLKNKLKSVLVIFSLLLSSSVIAEEPVSDTTKLLPTELFKNAVECTFITYDANTIESGIRYSYYKDTAKILGLYVLRLDEAMFIQVYNTTYKRVEQELKDMPSQDKLELFNTVCEGAVMKYYLNYTTLALEMKAMPYIQLHMNSVKVINEE